MSYQHKDLIAGRWSELSFIEQMANIGSEVERALNWQAKDNIAYSQQAIARAIELMDLTLDSLKGFGRLKEIARLREAVIGYFFGDNEFQFNEEDLRKYFYNFIYASRKNS